MRIPNKYNGYSADGIRLYNDPVSAAVVANAMAAGAGTLGTAAAAAAPAIAGTAASSVIPGLVSSAVPALAGQAAAVAAPALAGQAAMAAPSVIPGLIGSADPVFSAAANPLTNAMSTGASGFPLTPGGVAPMQPSFFDSFKGFAKENPMLTQMGFSTAKDVLTPDQINPAPIIPVQARGKLNPYDPMSYMNPYLQTVVGGGQPISLI